MCRLFMMYLKITALKALFQDAGLVLGQDQRQDVELWLLVIHHTGDDVMRDLCQLHTWSDHGTAMINVLHLRRI